MRQRLRKLVFNYIPTLIKTEIMYKMPFLYPLFEIKPSSCMILITNRCNLKCIMCKQWMEEPGNELKTEEWKEIIKDLKKNGIKNIHFTGGEPLLRKDLIEILLYCKKNDLVTGMTTNGSLLYKERLQDFVNAGLRSIAVSIDAINGKYDYLRGMKSSFIRVKEAVLLIADAKKREGIDAYINFTLMKNNIGEFENVKSLADDLRLPIAICLLDKHSSLFDVKENKNEFWITENEDYKRLEDLMKYLKNEKIKNPSSLLLNFPMIDFIKNYFKDPRQNKIPCVSSQDRVIIDPYGNFLGGCLSMGTFGNIKEKSFKKLQIDNYYKRTKKNMFYKRCTGCSCGYNFNIKSFPDLILKDLYQRIKFISTGN